VQDQGEQEWDHHHRSIIRHNTLSLSLPRPLPLDDHTIFHLVKLVVLVLLEDLPCILDLRQFRLLESWRVVVVHHLILLRDLVVVLHFPPRLLSVLLVHQEPEGWVQPNPLNSTMPSITSRPSNDASPPIQRYIANSSKYYIPIRRNNVELRRCWMRYHCSLPIMPIC